MDIQLIKQELQGSKGLIKIIRKKYLSNTMDMAIQAQIQFENLNIDNSKIDLSLDTLLKLEYELFLKKQNDVVENFISYAEKEVNYNKFPFVKKIIDDYLNNTENNGRSTSNLSGIVKVIICLADSNRQSRVSRSGSSLMHHISYLLIKNGFKIFSEFQREFVLKSGCKLDFFFPDLKNYNIEPKNCCAVACQTTANDRFRLSIAQMPNDTRNRACTAIGSSNFGPKLGPSSLTDNKLDEAKKRGVKFVILKDAIDDRLRKSNAVISYQDWFSELESLKVFWIQD